MKNLSQATSKFIQRTIEVYNLPQTETITEELALKAIDHAVCWLHFLEEELDTDEEDLLMANSAYKSMCERIEELHNYVA